MEGDEGGGSTTYVGALDSGAAELSGGPRRRREETRVDGVTAWGG